MSEFAPRSFSDRLHTLIDDLRFAEEELKKEASVSVSILRELRQALDNIRLTAWTVSELQSAREANRDSQALMSFLTAERLRRFRQMVDDFSTDLEQGGVAWPSASIYGLQESVSLLRERLGLLTFRRRGHSN